MFGSVRKVLNWLSPGSDSKGRKRPRDEDENVLSEEERERLKRRKSDFASNPVRLETLFSPFKSVVDRFNNTNNTNHQHMNGTSHNDHANMNGHSEKEDNQPNGFVDLTDEPVEEEDEVIVDDNVTITNLLHNNNNNKTNWQDTDVDVVNNTNTNPAESVSRLSPRNFTPKSTRAFVSQPSSANKSQKIDAVDILSDLTPVSQQPSKSIEEHLKESLYVTPSRSRPTVIDRIESIEEDNAESDFLDSLLGPKPVRQQVNRTPVAAAAPEPRQQVVDEDIEFNRQVRDVRRKSIGELLPRARLEDVQPTVDVVTPAKGNFDSFIKNFASPITSRKPSAGYQDVDLWQLELENEQYRRKQDYVSKQLQSLRELSEKYRNSEVKIDEQFLKRIQLAKEEERKKELAKKAQASAEEDFKPLTPEDEELVRSALKGGDLDIVSAESNLELERKDLRRLQHTEWLNDEVVNFYMNVVLTRRSKELGNKCHFFNSFFYPLLSSGGGYNYSRVQKWTKTIDIFALDKILVPIHLGNHWCLAVVNFSEKRFEYYDSLGGENKKCLERLERYVKDEYKTKHNGEFDTSQWEFHTPLDIPHQQNGYDCGVFMCKFADYSSKNKPFNFSQNHMKYFRHRMILEIMKKQALS
jgi:sentrin-specific protease 1